MIGFVSAAVLTARHFVAAAARRWLPAHLSGLSKGGPVLTTFRWAYDPLKDARLSTQPRQLRIAGKAENDVPLKEGKGSTCISWAYLADVAQTLSATRTAEM